MGNARDTGRGAGAPRWMRVLLVVSLGLNVLMLGMATGTIARYGGFPGGESAAAREPRSVGTIIFRELPGKDRRALWRRSNGPKMDHHMRQMTEARAVSAALRATPFDRAAIEKILNQQAERRQKFQQAVQQAWLDRVEAMSPSEREAYARRLEHAMDAPRYKPRRTDVSESN